MTSRTCRQSWGHPHEPGSPSLSSFRLRTTPTHSTMHTLVTPRMLICFPHALTHSSQREKWILHFSKRRLRIPESVPPPSQNLMCMRGHVPTKLHGPQMGHSHVHWSLSASPNRPSRVAIEVCDAHFSHYLLNCTFKWAILSVLEDRNSNHVFSHAVCQSINSAKSSNST